MNKKIELLAPAGSPEALMAGIEAGADAFYCGAPDFNARKRAKNFTREDIEGASALLHSKGKKLYIALNTLIYDRELYPVIDLLHFLNKVKVDAVIVQDIGLMELITKNFPDLSLHASTQAFAHNKLQCEFLKSIGVKRIVLPREMKISEIAAIQKLVPMEYEIFVHGAMCFSFSGACLFSSYEHGCSGNRGHCKQICRHSFSESEGGSEVYPFSMKDLDSSPIINKILDLKPTSLKIEGRLKNSDYVYKTVSYYRQLIDNNTKHDTSKVELTLKGQRKSGTGYFNDINYSDLVAIDSIGMTGESIGIAEILRKGEISLTVERPLQKGSRLRIADEKGRVVYDGTLLQFKTKPVGPSFLITWLCPDALPYKGTLKVLLLGSTNPQDPTRAFTHALSELKQNDISIALNWKRGNLLCAVKVGSDIIASEIVQPLNLEEARSEGSLNALSEKMAIIFKESAAHTFNVTALKIDIPSNKFAPPSILKSLKRSLFDGIEKHLSDYRKDREVSLMKIVSEANEAKFASIMDVNTHQKINSSSEFIDFEEVVLNKKPLAAPSSTTYLLLPLYVSDTKLPLWEKEITELIQNGYTHFIASNYGWLSFLFSIDGQLSIIAGPYLYCTNRWTLGLLLANGVEGFLLSPDIAIEEIAPINDTKLVKVLSNGKQEFFNSRVRLPKEHYFYKGRKFTVVKHDEYDTLISE